MDERPVINPTYNLGDVTVTPVETEQGVVLFAEGGTSEDQRIARALVSLQLGYYGHRIATTEELPVHPSQSIVPTVLPRIGKTAAMKRKQLPRIAGRDRWQTGGCADYAQALCNVYPHLRVGRVFSDSPEEGRFTHHVFAHDDKFAYDSLGRTLLPYDASEFQGEGGPVQVEYDLDPRHMRDYVQWDLDTDGSPSDEELARAGVNSRISKEAMAADPDYIANWNDASVNDASVNEDSFYDYFQPREHDYDPHWNYEVRYNDFSHPLHQIAQQRMDELAARNDTPFSRGWVIPADLSAQANPSGEDAAGVYASGTYNEPVVMLDYAMHERHADDPHAEVLHTVDHEVRHAMQEHGHDSAEPWVGDEDDAEGHRFASVGPQRNAHVKTSDWNEVMSKAVRLLRGGNVVVNRNGWTDVVGTVQGDHDTYNVELNRQDPQSRVLTFWKCQCPWSQYVWQRCVIEGTLITMADGTQRLIEEIKVGDRVVDHTGQEGLVEAVHSEDWDDDVVTIRTTGYGEITVKADHPVWGVEADDVRCRNKNGSLMKRSGTGWKGFCALETCGCRNPRQEVVIPDFRLAEEFAKDDFLVRPHYQPVEALRRIDLLPLTTGEVVVEDQIIPTRSFLRRHWRTGEVQHLVARQAKASIPRYVDITPDFMLLLGYYVAEGMIAHYSVRFCFHRDEVEYHDDVRRIAYEIFGTKVRDENNGTNALNVSINNREIASVFRSMFSTGADAKSLPEWLMKLPVNLQAHFIEGWFRGDGHTRKTDGRCEITTTSSQLAYQLELLLQRQGFTPGRVHERRSEATYASLKTNSSDAYKVYWVPRPRKLSGVRFSEGGNTMVRVENVERTSYHGKLYDLSINGNPGYLANGFSVHNTRKWKKYEGRCCAHALSLYWKALSTPLDEQVPEGQTLPRGQRGPKPPEGPLSGPGGGHGPGGPPPGAGGPPMGPAGDMGAAPEEAPIGVRMSPQEQLQQQLTQGPAPAAPGSQGVIPPNPMDKMQQWMQWQGPGTTDGGQESPPWAVSVPGAKQPSPFNPIHMPGTYSKVAAEQFVNGQIVRLRQPAYGVAEGPVKGQYGDGLYQEIPVGSKGEVISQDATTGWLECIFPLNDTGPHQPYHLRCFLDADDVVATGDLPATGFITRHT